MKIKTSLLCVATSLALTTSAFAKDVAIVNLDTVFQQAPQGNANFSLLKQQLTPQINQFEAQQKSLEKQIAAYDTNTKLSKTQKQTEKAKLITERTQLEQSLLSLQNEANQSQQALLSAFGDSVKTAVAQVAKADDIDLVLSSQNALYNEPKSDITNEVVAAMKAMPVPKVKALSTATAPATAKTPAAATTPAPATQAGS